MIIKNVIKSNGELVPFDASKLNAMAAWGSSIGISWSDVVLDAVKKVADGCSTKDLQTALIDACANKETKPYLQMAARLFLGSLYKEAHGGFENRPTLFAFYTDMVYKEVWEEMDYSKDELEFLGSRLANRKDLTYKYSMIKQIASKYSKKHKGRICETPQYTFMGIAMKVMETQPKDRRLQDVVKLYHYYSDSKINAPTPFLSGLRTKFKGYASCAVLKGNDTANSLEVVTHAAYKMTIASAGIGVTMQTRSKGDPVNKGSITHTGKLPYYRYLEGAVKSTKQSTRGGGATMHYTVLDPEIEDLLRLKHPTTVADKKIRGLDYSIGVNRYFAEVAAKDGDWALCSLLHAPEVHNAMYKGYAEFKEAYESYIASSKPKKMVKAKSILLLLTLTQRQDTGRIYIHWLDEMNTHTPFLDPIYSSNLCKEIDLPTEGYEDVMQLYTEHTDTSGEIALCFLSSIVAGNVTPEEYEDVAYYTLLSIDNVIDIMQYPFPQLEFTAKARRSVGVGITDLAHLLAMNKLSYSTLEGKNFIHKHAEMHSYYLHKASLRLAKEKGVCDWIGRTKYPKGWTPLSTYNKNIDSVHTEPLHFDWDTLSKDIIANGGIRNSVLEATPPGESSSLASNSTNGVYPIRDPYVTKKSGTTKVVFAAPDYEELKDYYELAWDIDTKHLTDMYCIIQKFHGQGISSDYYTDFSKFLNEKVPASKLYEDFFYATKMGSKAWYYNNSKGGVSEYLTNVVDDTIVEEDTSCESCKM